METQVYNAYANIIKEIPGQDSDVEEVFTVFKKYIPDIVERYGVVYFSVLVTEPPKGRYENVVSKNIVIYGNEKQDISNSKDFIFEMGNGGFCKNTIALLADTKWTKETESELYVLSRMFYLLMGRSIVMRDLQHLTFNDALTGITNKTGVVKHMVSLIIEGTFFDYSANFVNIKNMKLLNNRFTERGGDEILIKYTHAIQDYIGDKGIIGRLGGDNFCVFILGDMQKDFLDFMKNLEIEMALPRSDKRIPVKIDSRIGYYMIKPGDSFDKALDSSSIAMSFAKQDSHPDIMQFENWMKAQILQLKELEENIPQAIDNEEFVIYYQPKADITDENNYTLCGAEALVRWQKNGEMISPNDFIPILEKNGMVSFVDFYVLEHVCRDIEKWQKMGLKPVRVSSNFSRRHLKDEYFADKVEAIFRKYDINPNYLEIEITESYDVEDLEALTRFEKRMHGLGINLSVDDFGSGFSSLKVIKNIVADVIKLDKSLIDGVGSDEEDGIIVSHLIQMIKNLGKEIIAEGVEEKAQADFLRQNNCNHIQGFLYAKPMPEEQFEAYLSKVEE